MFCFLAIVFFTIAFFIEKKIFGLVTAVLENIFCW